MNTNIEFITIQEIVEDIKLRYRPAYRMVQATYMGDMYKVQYQDVMKVYNEYVQRLGYQDPYMQQMYAKAGRFLDLSTKYYMAANQFS